MYEICESHSLGSKLLGHAMTWLAKMPFLINDKRKSHISKTGKILTPGCKDGMSVLYS
jgi:hypothetical protein